MEGYIRCADRGSAGGSPQPRHWCAILHGGINDLSTIESLSLQDAHDEASARREILGSLLRRARFEPGRLSRVGAADYRECLETMGIPQTKIAMLCRGL